MITLRNLSKSFGLQTIFESVSLQINERDRFALVGPNGAGKSTLFKLIMGVEEPESGEVALRTGMRFGYLPQETFTFAGRQVLHEVLTDPEAASGSQTAQAQKILQGLGFKPSDMQRPIQELSGGWQMRVAIAKLLYEKPDILLLDEPTNHLDLESLLWFQRYLQSYEGAIFLISHDRAFVNAIVDRIVEVRDHHLRVYTGTFEDYLEERLREKENLIQAYHRQQKEIQELEDFIARFRAKASTASRAQAKIKYLEKMERIELPEEAQTVDFSFPQPTRSGQNALVLKNIAQSYDGIHPVYNGLDLTLERGQRVAFIGPNGAGKSTLLKILAGQIPIQSGERKEGYNVEVGYFSQHRAEMFRPGKTVLEEASNTRRNHSLTTIRSVLGSFLFRNEAVNKKVEVLSGGEKSRLGLARLLLDPPNVLLLDEPTTHLDIASVEMLITALKKYEGTICIISHDVYFLRQIANHVLHINQGKVTWYPGDYDYFLHKKALEDSEESELFRAEEESEARHAPKHHVEKDQVPSPGLRPPSPTESGRGIKGEGSLKSGPKSKEQKRLEAEARQTRYRQEQEAKRKEDIRKQLQQAESLILSELGRPTVYQDKARVIELNTRLAEIKKQMAALLS